MITIELGGRSATVPNVSTSERHYADYTSAELVALGVRTRNSLEKATGRRSAVWHVQLYVLERELMRRGVVTSYSEKAQKVSNRAFEALMHEWP